ncbi:hypothetical protein EYF80_060044 [Liparis tanakae]|nr:hypothetical protein EYF80_060044 [Liparis tanakae]
MWRSMWP